MTDYRAADYYKSLLRSVKFRMKNGVAMNDAINASMQSAKFNGWAQMGAVDCLVEDLEVNAIAANDELVTELQKSEQVMEAQAKKVGMTRAERVAATHEEARRLGFWDGQGKWDDAYTAMQKWKKENGFLGKPFGTAKR